MLYTWLNSHVLPWLKLGTYIVQSEVRHAKTKPSIVLKNFWHKFGRNVQKRSPSTMFWDHPFANSARYPGSRVAAGTPLLFRLNWVTALDEGSWILYWIFLGDLTSRNWGLISWVLIGLIGFHGIELVAICCEGIHGRFHGFWYWSVQIHVNGRVESTKTKWEFDSQNMWYNSKS
jgi:hypothetical protein